MHYLMQRIERVLTFEGPLSSRSFKKNAAEGEDVRAVVQLSHFTLRLFGRHVSGCPHDHAGHRVLGQDSRGGLTGSGLSSPEALCGSTSFASPKSKIFA